MAIVGFDFMKNAVVDHKKCPWCKKDTKKSAGCFDEDGSLWAIICHECHCSGPLVKVEEDVFDFDEDDEAYEDHCEKKAFDAWDWL